MGEQKEGEGAKPDAEKKPDADDGMVTAVYKIDMHCEGCANKIKRSIKHYEGVEDVKTDAGANKLTVIGKIDPAKIRERLAEKIKKKVDLISPQPRVDAAAVGDKKSEAEKKPEEEKAEERPTKESVVVLKIRTHCDGCMHKIRKIIFKLDGVESVDVNGAKDLVTMKGRMNVKDLVPYLQQKLRRNVEVVPPKKDDAGEKIEPHDDKEMKGKEAVEGGEKKEEGGGEKKESGRENKESDGGEKKEKGETRESGGGEANREVSKMEYRTSGYTTPQPMYWSNGHVFGGPSYSVEAYLSHHQDSIHVNPGYMLPYPGYANQGYMIDPRHPLHAPQIVSDENPTACSVM